MYIRLSQYLTGQNVVIYMKESDVSGNGVVDQADSQLLAQYLVEIVVTLGPSPIDSSNPFRYCGEYFDKETNTVYLRARYYNPRIGRFITEDSFKGFANNSLSLNLYTYGHNNPVRFFDPSGHVVTEWDKKNCSQYQIQKIQEATREWNRASLLGDQKGMEAAHKKAVATRTSNLSKNQYVDSSGFTITIPQAPNIVTAKDKPQKLPTEGTPNSKDTLHNPDGTLKQERWYGPDGKVLKDRDYSHPGEGHVFPHEHEWKNEERSKKPTPVLPQIPTPQNPFKNIKIPSPNTGDSIPIIGPIIDGLKNMFK